MKKRGISPLIATVLILGFTVALAAVIMTWGTAFTRSMQKQTEETSNVQILCATDVIFDVKSVCNTTDIPTKYQILIQNDGKESIKKWNLRFYEDETKAATVLNKVKEIPAFGLDKITISSSDIPNLLGVRKIEAVPIIREDIVCSQNIDSYGNTAGNTIDSKCS